MQKKEEGRDPLATADLVALPPTKCNGMCLNELLLLYALVWLSMHNATMQNYA